jgi:HD superfamily phosphohydrolase
LTSKSFVHDPIHGTIEIPNVLNGLLKEKSVRRMQFIRQLGLKAFIDFPNAIHTRYSHVLGVMHLTGRVVDKLYQLETTSGRTETAQTLFDNKNNLMAAGLLHDIGHGPFSHVLDFFLEEHCNIDHEQKGKEFIEKFSWLDDRGLNVKKIQKMIEGKHPLRFINDIITGPLDCDKLDYLLRDSYHVGLRYSFDLNYFINNYRILGENISKLENCEVGLVDSNDSIKTAEIFILIWKNMYDLVYYINDSRIAEKMLEKAIILKNESDKSFVNCFKEPDRYVDMDDEKLLNILEKDENFSAKLVKSIRNNEIYSEIFSKDIRSIEPYFEGGIYTKFLDELDNNSNKVADKLSKILCEESKSGQYYIICDFVKSRKPKSIHINNYTDEGEPVELSTRSDIIRAIKEETTLKIYINNSIKNGLTCNEIEKFIKCSVNEYFDSKYAK